jgi:hypothetical protein
VQKKMQTTDSRKGNIKRRLFLLASFWITDF